MRPWLWLPPKLAHDVAPFALQLLTAFLSKPIPCWAPREWRGMRFSNPLGIAGGVDKDGAQIEDWWKLGAGFVEIGTVTPRAQLSNPGTIIARDPATKSLWNRMGFPGAGVSAMRANLADLAVPDFHPSSSTSVKTVTPGTTMRLPTMVFAYASLRKFADIFVVNISSPNTAGLRDLLQPTVLSTFLTEVIAERNRWAPDTPVLLKLSPDLLDTDIPLVTELALEAGVDGCVATNTTLARPPRSLFPSEGGVSGAPLADRSKTFLKILKPYLDQDHLLISVGGILTPEDVSERLALGADLVQVYTALIYEGPFFFQKVAQHMASHT